MKGNCHYCKKPGHHIANCYILSNRLKRAGKLIVEAKGHDEDSDEEVGKMMKLYLNNKKKEKSKN